MVIVLKLTGFPRQTKPKEILEFLKQSYVTDYQLFLCLDETAKQGMMCNGTAYVLAKSEFDAVSVLRLREQRVGSKHINVLRSNISDLRNNNLFPKPSPSLFEVENSPQDAPKTYVPKETLSKGSERDKSLKKRRFSTELSPKLKNLKPHSSKLTKRQNSSFNDQSSAIKYNKQKAENVQPIVYDCYVKLFSLPPEVSKRDVFEFLQTSAFPVDIMFSTFDSGPHFGKKRGEAFVLLGSTREALKCIRLNSEKLGSRRVSVVFPSKEEVDTAIFQNADSLTESTPILSTRIMSENPAKSQLHTFSSHTLQTKNALTSVSTNGEDAKISDGGQDFPQPPSPSHHSAFVFMRILNLPSGISYNDILAFFDGFSVKSSSLKKVSASKKSEEWEIAFHTRQEASAAVRKLSYQLLRHQPIELKIL